MEIESAIGRPFDLLAAFDRIDHAPRGRDGGKDGQAGSVKLKTGRKLEGKGIQVIPAGERLIVLTPGGGGIGAPQSRARAAVEADVADGLVSAATAGKVYGRERGKPSRAAPGSNGRRRKRPDGQRAPGMAPGSAEW